ncbi:MAG: transcriptional repressor [Spirochaetales bacterium]|nr:transcriptional repressor [Spirochaetales bacterium]
MKYSKQREIILKTLKAADSHLTAEDLYHKVREIIPRISLGTIYRNLNLLVELGEIRTLQSSDSPSILYDGRSDEHCHLICTVCGKITDIELSLFTPFDLTVYEKTGFLVDDHDLVLKGTCADCLEKRRSTEL